MSFEWLNPYHLQVGSFILINVLLGISIYVTLATGQLSLGNAGFMSIGAYASAILTTQHGFSIPSAIVIGSLLAGVSGILVGIPALRLRGVYLAIATLGFGEVLRVVFINWESLTGGAVGIAAIPQMGREILAAVEAAGFSPEDWGLRNNQFISLSIFLILAAVVVLAILFFLRLFSSRVGRAYTAIRMDETAAETSGIDTTYYKVLAFSQGALLSGQPGRFHVSPRGGDPGVRRLRRKRGPLRPGLRGDAPYPAPRAAPGDQRLPVHHLRNPRRPDDGLPAPGTDRSRPGRAADRRKAAGRILR